MPLCDFSRPTQSSVTPEDFFALTEEAVAVFDEEGAMVFASKRIRQILGRLEGVLSPGTPFALVLSEAVRQGVISEADALQLSLIEEQLETGGAPVVHGALDTPNGRFIATLVATRENGFALRFSDADAELDDETRELEQLMAKVLEACPTCLIMARIGDGQILYRSPEATALLGKGFNSREHFARREERADFITALLGNARVDDMRITALRGDGATFEAVIAARLIDYRGEDVIVASIHDLTEELALRHELDLQRQQVFRSEKMSALGEVLAGVAHELNNPLSIVVGNAQLLSEDGLEGPSLKRAERVSEAAERCVSIVRAFLSMARERPLELERSSAKQLLETAEDAFTAADERHIEIVTSVEEDLPDLNVDEVQLVQVFTNLMTNAAQAMEGQANARIALSALRARQAGFVQFRVKDNGPGIAADVAQRIFDPLFTTKAIGKGTGLGLALCHRIIVGHGGRLELEQSDAPGASFVIELPAGVPDVSKEVSQRDQ